MMVPERRGHYAAGRLRGFDLINRTGCCDLRFNGEGGDAAARRAKLDRDQLHDGVQFAGCDLPNNLCSPACAGGGHYHHDVGQRHAKHVMPAQLHEPANFLPD
jgi:hypothetical protein